jgi:hypothetical protein
LRDAAVRIGLSAAIWANNPGNSPWQDIAAKAKHHDLSAEKHAITEAD